MRARSRGSSGELKSILGMDLSCQSVSVQRSFVSSSFLRTIRIYVPHEAERFRKISTHRSWSMVLTSRRIDRRCDSCSGRRAPSGTPTPVNWDFKVVISDSGMSIPSRGKCLVFGELFQLTESDQRQPRFHRAFRDLYSASTGRAASESMAGVRETLAEREAGEHFQGR